MRFLFLFKDLSISFRALAPSAPILLYLRSIQVIEELEARAWLKAAAPSSPMLLYPRSISVREDLVARAWLKEPPP